MTLRQRYSSRCRFSSRNFEVIAKSMSKTSTNPSTQFPSRDFSYVSLCSLYDLILTTVKKLKETQVTVQQLDKNMSNLRTWLSHIEAELSKPVVYNICDNDEIQKKLSEQQDLQRDIEQHTDGVATVINLCDVLLHDSDACTTETECDSIQQTTASLDRRWRNICAMSMERRMKIEETCRLWSKFLDDYSRFEDWLKTAERTAACPNSAEVLYTSAKEELKKFEAFQRQVHERLTQLELVNKQYRRLARENRTDTASRLKLMVHEGNQRWDNLQKRVAAILRRLKYFTSQREEFEGTRDGILVWLTEMDLQLTNVEHFSESDIEDKMRQLDGFQQEITLNTNKIDQLIVFGENLIQKSQPLDAVLIEDELEELHSYCQEVFGRVARFHHRLINKGPVSEDEKESSDRDTDLEDSAELQGIGWQEKMGHEVSPSCQSMCQLMPPTAGQERSGRETPISVDSIPLEWDHTVDVGGSSSHEDEEEPVYYSALSEQCVLFREGMNLSSLPYCMMAVDELKQLEEFNRCLASLEHHLKDSEGIVANTKDPNISDPSTMDQSRVEYLKVSENIHITTRMLKLYAITPDLEYLNDLSYKIPLNDVNIKRVQTLNRLWAQASSRALERCRSEFILKLSLLKEQWQGAIRRAQQRKGVIEGLVRQWHHYQDSLKKLKTFLSDTANHLDLSNSQAHHGLHQTRREVEDIKHKEMLFQRHRCSYILTLETGKQIFSMANPETETLLQEELCELQESWEHTETLLKEKKQLMNTSLEEAEESLEDWTRSLAELSTMKTDLSHYIITDDVVILQEQIQHLHSQWDELCLKLSLLKEQWQGAIRRAQQRKGVIEGLVRQWHHYQDSLKKLKTFLSDTANHLDLSNSQAHHGLHQTRREVEDIKHKEMLFQRHRCSYILTLETGKQIFSMANPETETLLQEELCELQESWEHTETLLKEKKQLMNTSLEDYKTEMNCKQLNVDFVNQSVLQISSLDIQSKRYDMAEFAECLGALNLQWQLLQGALSSKMRAVEHMLTVFTEKERKMQLISCWCKAQEERILGFQTPASLTSAENALKDCQEIEEKLKIKSKEIQELKHYYLSPADDSSEHLHIDFITQMDEVNADWTRLNNQVIQTKASLQLTVQQWKAFDETFQEVDLNIIKARYTLELSHFPVLSFEALKSQVEKLKAGPGELQQLPGRPEPHSILHVCREWAAQLEFWLEKATATFRADRQDMEMQQSVAQQLLMCQSMFLEIEQKVAFLSDLAQQEEAWCQEGTASTHQEAEALSSKLEGLKSSLVKFQMLLQERHNEEQDGKHPSETPLQRSASVQEMLASAKTKLNRQDSLQQQKELEMELSEQKDLTKYLALHGERMLLQKEGADAQQQASLRTSDEVSKSPEGIFMKPLTGIEASAHESEDQASTKWQRLQNRLSSKLKTLEETAHQDLFSQACPSKESCSELDQNLHNVLNGTNLSFSCIEDVISGCYEMSREDAKLQLSQLENLPTELAELHTELSGSKEPLIQCVSFIGGEEAVLSDCLNSLQSCLCLLQSAVSSRSTLLQARLDHITDYQAEIRQMHASLFEKRSVLLQALNEASGQSIAVQLQVAEQLESTLAPEECQVSALKEQGERLHIQAAVIQGVYKLEDVLDNTWSTLRVAREELKESLTTEIQYESLLQGLSSLVDAGHEKLARNQHLVLPSRTVLKNYLKKHKAWTHFDKSSTVLLKELQELEARIPTIGLVEESEERLLERLAIYQVPDPLIQGTVIGCKEEVDKYQNAVLKCSFRKGSIELSVWMMSAMDRLRSLKQQSLSVPQDLEKVRDHLGQFLRVWDEVDRWHSRLTSLEAEVQDLAEQNPNQAQQMMDSLMEPLQLYQRAAQQAEQRTAFLSKITNCLQEYNEMINSSNVWIDDTQAWLSMEFVFDSAKSLHKNVKALQIARDDGLQRQKTLQGFAPILQEISLVCDTMALEQQGSHVDQKITALLEGIMGPLSQLQHVATELEAMETEVKLMEKNVAKIRTILSSDDMDEISPEEHLRNREVILENIQSMKKTIAEIKNYEPREAIASLVVYKRAEQLLPAMEELEHTTVQQKAVLQVC
ncbi:Nesprin-2 [Acipenser ruthenus]|uniref:Nesprin-2 n=1 Tax=Acipenser ruthenus TaxID=7906 RepID=A0A444V3C3_ACIRT|nr:Nesprin-2 [Acipenser ruthenus]